ncbi:unnamed protein product, partial [Brachionus calyciflorus]
MSVNNEKINDLFVECFDSDEILSCSLNEIRLSPVKSSMSPNNYELNDLTPDVDKDLSFSTSEKSLTLESVENKENLSLIFKDN